MAASRAVSRWDLSGKVAVVTGAGRGIGRAVASALAEAGAEVLAVARTASDLASLSADGVKPWVADVCDQNFYQQVAGTRVDILVNNAGSNRPLPIEKVPVEVLDGMLQLNVRAAYLTAQAAVRSMKAHGAGGSIVNVTSQMGHVGSPNRTVYCMTKHALEGLTKAMAVELAVDGIRVNSVAPTFVETPMTKPMLDDPSFRDFVLGSIPLGRLATVEEVADAVLYLASPAANMITGTSLLVDGGWTAK